LQRHCSEEAESGSDYVGMSEDNDIRFRGCLDEIFHCGNGPALYIEERFAQRCSCGAPPFIEDLPIAARI